MLTRSPMKRRQRKTGPTSDVVEVVLGRCDYRCEICGDALSGVRGIGWALHHRRYRDGRDDQDTPQNTLAVCGGSNVDRCHGLIHSGKAYAITRGWALTRHGRADPARTPVLINHGSRWVHLWPDGEYHDDPPEADRG